jgi:hypothetical protein
MSDIQWDGVPEVAVPQGTFIGWGRVGQTITGIVRGYSADAGSDFKNEPCPLLTLELTAPAENYRDKGTTRETIAAGELVSITAGQAGLRRRLHAITPPPRVGDAMRVMYDGTYPTGKGDGKSFEVKHVAGAGLDHVLSTPLPTSTRRPLEDEEPF